MAMRAGVGGAQGGRKLYDAHNGQPQERTGRGWTESVGRALTAPS